MKTRWLVVSMVFAMTAVAGLAYWDERRESSASLEDFGVEQATLAAISATDLLGRLRSIESDARVIADDARQGRAVSTLIQQRYLLTKLQGLQSPPVVKADEKSFAIEVPVSGGQTVQLLVPSARLTSDFERNERPGEILFLLLPPGESAFQTLDGRRLQVPSIFDAFERGVAVLRLTQGEAARLGLPMRTAMVGLARVNAGPLGRWGVAIASTAERIRDRDRRRRARVVLAVVVGGFLVLTFGGMALRRQRHEMALAHELALAELARERDERLDRLSKVATTATLASGVAHELSTPLGVIVGRAEQILSRTNGDERSTKNAQAILDQAEHISSIIRGFLSLARGAPPALESIPPSTLVRDAFALVEHRFQQAGVHLKQTLPAEDLPNIRCEPRLMEHALVNLLLNACDACHENGQVELRAEMQTDAVAFVVTDNGVGITADKLTRVTEPFFTTKEADKGTGLGLAIANEIVKAHRGTLSIAPRQPTGTVASISIPVEGGMHAQS